MPSLPRHSSNEQARAAKKVNLLFARGSVHVTPNCRSFYLAAACFCNGHGHRQTRTQILSFPQADKAEYLCWLPQRVRNRPLHKEADQIKFVTEHRKR